jgi:hypothetical protein
MLAEWFPIPFAVLVYFPKSSIKWCLIGRWSSGFNGPKTVPFSGRLMQQDGAPWGGARPKRATAPMVGQKSERTGQVRGHLGQKHNLVEQNHHPSFALRHIKPFFAQ